MRKYAAVIVALIAGVLAGCTAAPAPAPTVTVTVAPEPTTEAAADGDAWQRFKDDPRDAFVFSSAYEIIWGHPLGNGELADTVVDLAYTMCSRVEDGDTWDEVQALIDPEDAELYVATAQVYCPEIK